MNKSQLETAFINATDSDEKWRIYQLLADLQHKQETAMIAVLYQEENK